jgi:hypothetical protein
MSKASAYIRRAAANGRGYSARTIKRARRSKAQVATLDSQIMQAITGDHPQSVRHLFYLMTNPRLAEPVEKSDRGYRHVQYRVVELRRAGLLPYGWITDASRRGYFTPTFLGAGDFIRRVKGLYRADLWKQAESYCEVWTESRSIAGIIEDDCEELAVSLYPAGGFSSITLAYQAAKEINETADGKPVVIFYIGDHDPAGVLIDEALKRELLKHLNPNIELTFIRLGITAEQIEAYDLPTKPRKAADRRSLHVARTVEAEAMPAATMRRILRDSIEALLPENALKVARAAEESERSLLSIVAQQIEEARP